jgi:hypothetical protein
MARVTWAIRVMYANGRSAFIRRGGRPGTGPIATFYSKAAADAEAAILQEALDDDGAVVAVIERSHGRLPFLSSDRAEPSK